MYYQFFNNNPLGKRQEDCVCRAISGALDMDYYDVSYKLHLVGELFECEQLCVCCYKFLLDNIFNLKRIEEYKGYTIKEFIDCMPYGRYIIRIDGHLTWVLNGEVKDIWDCSDKVVDIIWIV